MVFAGQNVGTTCGFVDFYIQVLIAVENVMDDRELNFNRREREVICSPLTRESNVLSYTLLLSPPICFFVPSCAQRRGGS